MAELARAGMETDLAEARLLLADSMLAAGDPKAAEELAALARSAFLAQGRAAWVVMARYAWVRARWAAGDRSEETLVAAKGLVTDLERSGWSAPALHTRILAARIALDRGDLETAGAELERATGSTRRLPADMRIQAWHAKGTPLLEHR